MAKINEITVGGVTYDIQDKNASPQSFAERMLEVDKRGLESGDYNKEQYDAFRQKYPNRVYLEKYNKYADGSEVERIYNKVALTAMPEAPWDFDEGDYGYRLESVPLRLGGGKPTDAGAYQEGHIRVPKLSKSEFPKEEDAKTFAITKVYADSAIVEGYQVPLIKSGCTLDDKCICVDSKNGVYSSVSIYSGNSNKNYVVFESAVWCDFSKNTSGNLEFSGYDANKNRAILFYFDANLKGYVQISGGYATFEAKPHIRSREWFKLRIEMVSSTSIKVFINDELMVETEAGTFSSSNLYMTISPSTAFAGKVAFANIAFLTASSERELSEEDYYDLDEYSELSTTIPSAGVKTIIRRASNDVWNVSDYETFTNDDGYVLVNKKYLRKMLENAGGGNKLKYQHKVTVYFDGDWNNQFGGTITFLSNENTPITSIEEFNSYRESINNNATSYDDFYLLHPSADNDDATVSYYKIERIEFYDGEYNEMAMVYYYETAGGTLKNIEYSANWTSSAITDVVTEV